MYLIIIDFYNGYKKEYYTSYKSVAARIKELEKKSYISIRSIYVLSGKKIYGVI